MESLFDYKQRRTKVGCGKRATKLLVSNNENEFALHDHQVFSIFDVNGTQPFIPRATGGFRLQTRLWDTALSDGGLICSHYDTKEHIVYPTNSLIIAQICSFDLCGARHASIARDGPSVLLVAGPTAVQVTGPKWQDVQPFPEWTPHLCQKFAKGITGFRCTPTLFCVKEELSKWTIFHRKQPQRPPTVFENVSHFDVKGSTVAVVQYQYEPLEHQLQVTKFSEYQTATQRHHASLKETLTVAVDPTESYVAWLTNNGRQLSNTLMMVEIRHDSTAHNSLSMCADFDKLQWHAKYLWLVSSADGVCTIDNANVYSWIHKNNVYTLSTDTVQLTTAQPVEEVTVSRKVDMTALTHFVAQVKDCHNKDTLIAKLQQQVARQQQEIHAQQETAKSEAQRVHRHILREKAIRLQLVDKQEEMRKEFAAEKEAIRAEFAAEKETMRAKFAAEKETMRAKFATEKKTMRAKFADNAAVDKELLNKHDQLRQRVERSQDVRGGGDHQCVIDDLWTYAQHLKKQVVATATARVAKTVDMAKRVEILGTANYQLTSANIELSNKLQTSFNRWAGQQGRADALDKQNKQLVADLNKATSDARELEQEKSALLTLVNQYKSDLEHVHNEVKTYSALLESA
ncbi:hypothetical protein OAM67_00475 [bacterium]|nr:hypothetical protein [bacterium]